METSSVPAELSYLVEPFRLQDLLDESPKKISRSVPRVGRHIRPLKENDVALAWERDIMFFSAGGDDASGVDDDASGVDDDASGDTASQNERKG
jgi:hypothetical protein